MACFSRASFVACATVTRSKSSLANSRQRPPDAVCRAGDQCGLLRWRSFSCRTRCARYFSRCDRSEKREKAVRAAARPLKGATSNANRAESAEDVYESSRAPRVLRFRSGAASSRLRMPRATRAKPHGHPAAHELMTAATEVPRCADVTEVANMATGAAASRRVLRAQRCAAARRFGNAIEHEEAQQRRLTYRVTGSSRPARAREAA